MDNINVNLTLEETGVLCHLLLPAIVKLYEQKPRGPILTKEVLAAQTRMAEKLYQKLSEANDLLMGKKK